MHSELLKSITNISHSFGHPEESEPESLYRLKQVHSPKVILLQDQDTENLKTTQADGLITKTSNRIGIQTADCLPVLFASKDGSAVASVHAGWRGLNSGILVEAIERFKKLNQKAEDLVVALGPCINQCCFEVNQETLDLFEAKWGELWKKRALPWRKGQSETSSQTRAKPTANDLWIDLKAIAKLQLEHTGIQQENIESVGSCTYCGSEKLASFRRGTHEGYKAKRQWSWIKILA